MNTSRVALVTGAADGIGRATAFAFLASGATVMAVDSNAAGLGELAAAGMRVLVQDVSAADAPERIGALIAIERDATLAELAEGGKSPLNAAQRLEQCKRTQTTKVAFRAPAKETLGGEETYRRAAAAAVLIGSAYKCDKCTRWHNSLASGVVVDPDGVVATNHHVAAGANGEAMGVLTADGRFFPVTEVLAANKLFATLDPTTRRLALPSGRALLLTDTVGFVRRLPHRLVEAFKATLEEAVQADFLVHVIDLGSPERDKHAETTLQVLTEIGAGDRPVITVLNKADLCDEVERAQALAAYPDAKLVSTMTGEGLPALLQRLEECAASRDEHMTLLIPHDQYAMLSKLHAGATIINSKALPEGTRVEVYVPTRLQETCRAWVMKE